VRLNPTECATLDRLTAQILTSLHAQGITSPADLPYQTEHVLSGLISTSLFYAKLDEVPSAPIDTSIIQPFPEIEVPDWLKGVSA
jgi:hypothetical protein